MITITRKFSFDAGHRVLGHEGKCAAIHGHTYTAEVTVTAPGLDSLGRVIDFGEIKTRIGTWLDKYWDHNMICHPADPLLDVPSPSMGSQSIWGRKLPYVMLNGNPTAENMAKELFGVARGLLPQNLQVVRVKMWETPNCFADYTEPNQV